MHATRCDHLVRTVRRFVIGRETALPEGELLQAFVDRRDEEAFAALVERHGPMVFGVCQGVLRNRHDAEDAFQATFLVLANKARSIRRHASLGSWLHGVAVRVARKAFAASARRQAIAAKAEAPKIAAHAPGDDLSWREVHGILHEELAELREPFREPLVLCYLEGLTQDEAAGRLGWTATTVKGRLQRGRDLLRARLERRGLGLVAALGTTMLAGQALAAPVPKALAIATVRAAASGAGTAAHTTAVALARAIVMTTGPTRIRMVVALLLLLVTLAGGMLLLPLSPPGDDPPAQVSVPAAERKLEPRLDDYGEPLPDGALTRLGSTHFRVGNFTNALAFAPQGDVLAAIGHRGYYDGCLWFFDATTGRPVHRVAASRWDWTMAISPDGKWLFRSNSLALVEVATGKEVRRLAEPEKGSLQVVAFSPDSRTVAAAGGTPNGALIILWDVASGKEIRRLETPGAEYTWSIAFAPDGKTLASGAADQSVRLWDVATGKERRRFAGHTQGRVKFVAFAPNNKLLVSAGEDWVIRLWDVETGQPVRQLNGDVATMRIVALSPDGKLLASAGRVGTIHLWEVDTAKERCRWQAHRYDINSLAFSTDSTVLASAAQGDPAIRRWDTTGKEIDAVAGHTGRVDHVRFAADGKRLWSSGRDSQVREWDLTTGRQRNRLFARAMGPTVKGWGSRAGDLAPDGKLLALAGEWWTDESLSPDPVIRLCDTMTGKEIHVLAGHGEKDRVESVQLSPDSKFMASATAEDLRLWDVGTGKELYRTRGGAPLVFSPDSGLLAFVTRNASGGQRIHVWDVAARRELRSWNWESPYGRHLACVTFSPDGKAVAAASAGASRTGGTPGSDIRVWATDSGMELMRAASANTEGEMMIYVLAFSASGRMLAFGGSRESKMADGSGDCTIQILEVLSGKEIRRFEAPQEATWSLAFAPDGRTLASGGGDSTILLWDLTRLAADNKAKATHVPNAGALDSIWSNLAGTPVQADRALWALALAPAQSVPLLKERLRVVAAPPEQVAKLVVGLESDDFTLRESAAQELERFGASAEQAVRKVIKGDVTLEVRRRLEQYLQRRDSEVLRTLRAIEVLELIATPQARQVLETLAKEAANPRTTQAATAALHRLEKREILRP